MSNGTPSYSWSHYATAEEIRVGDRIAVANVEPGEIIGVWPPDSKEAIDWGLTNGGVQYRTDSGIVCFGPVADEDLVFVSRG
jgi:hypothetical protein